MLTASDYYDLLAGLGAELDIWRTTYHHPMDSPGAIVSWVRSTGLRPFVDPLPPDQQAGFLAAYQARIDRAYPVRADGKRLLAFPRLFIVARRAPDAARPLRRRGTEPKPIRRCFRPTGSPGTAMAEQQDEPDFIEGVALDAIPDGGLLAGWIGDRKGSTDPRG